MGSRVQERKKTSRCRTPVAMQLICPCLIGRKDLMTRSYPAAVGDTANAGSDKVFVVMMRQVQSGLMLDNSGRN